MNMETQSYLVSARDSLKSLKKLPISTIASLIFFSICISSVIYYIVGPSEGYLHSDCTDSLYWANATIENGKLIADNYRYAAILPFSANLWMIPMINAFGFTMKAQILSMLVFALLYVASQLWVFKTMRFSWALNFTATGCMLMLLSSSVKMREIMWEHVIYYSLAILLFNCLLALSLSAIRSWKKFMRENRTSSGAGFFIYIVLLSFISLGSALNGFQVIVMTSIPVFAGIVIEMFFESRKKLFTLENAARLSVSAVIPFFSLVGLILLKTLKGDVTANYTDYYSSFSSIDKWDDHIMKFPGHFLTLIGFSDDAVVLTEKEGIENLISIAVFVILVISPIVSLFFYNKFKRRETKAALAAYLTLFAAIMLIFICGNISNVNWRLVPVVGVSAIAVFAVVNELLISHKDNQAKNETDESAKDKNGASVPLRVASILICVFLVFSFVNYKEIEEMPEDYGRDNYLHRLADVLVENDLEYGYATFWYSQAITLLSDSKVKCREILATAKDGAKTDYYQSSYDWYLPQPGVEKYFVLLSNGEATTVGSNSTWRRWTEEQLIEIIDADGFMIYVFDGYLDGIK